jgi:glycosyltransferase involved in cell wall biosynthesis
VLAQTYPAIEMYVVDDGSTDNSAEVIKSYIPKFEARGYTLNYLYQENAGQSAAINNGLQYIQGEYFVWPDSDDYYADNTAIEQMVNVLKSSSDEFAMVRTQENIVEDADEIRILRVNGTLAHETEAASLFEDCLFQTNNFYYCPGAYMVKINALRNSTELPIYQSRNAGQNWQLMLPVLYHYCCKTILKPLYNVTERLTSHSRGQFTGYDKILLKIEAYEQTILNTLNRIKGMPSDRLTRYSEAISLKYCHEKFRLAIAFDKAAEAQQFYDKLKSTGRVSGKERLLLLLVQTRLFKPLKAIKHLVSR